MKNGATLWPPAAARIPRRDPAPHVRTARKQVMQRWNGNAFGGGVGLVQRRTIAVRGNEGATFSFSEVRIGVIHRDDLGVVLPKRAPTRHATSEGASSRRGRRRTRTRDRVVPADGLPRPQASTRVPLPRAADGDRRGPSALIRIVPGADGRGCAYAEPEDRANVDSRGREGMTAF